MPPNAAQQAPWLGRFELPVMVHSRGAFHLGATREGEEAPLLTIDEGGYYDFFFDFFQVFEREDNDDQLRMLSVPVELRIHIGETNRVSAGPLPSDPAATTTLRRR